MKETPQASTHANYSFEFELSKDGKIASANHTMIMKFLHSDPAVVPVNFFDFVHPFHLPGFKNAMVDAQRGLRQDNVEVYVKNGIYHPMKWQMKYDAGKFHCTGINILDDARLIKFNRLAKKHYQLIIEGIGGVLFHDKEGNLIAANHKAAEKFGSTLERLYQIRDVATLWDTQWDIRDEFDNKILFEDAPFRKAVTEGTPQKRTLVIKKLNGDIRYLLFNSQVLHQDEVSGDFTVLTNLIDVTKEKILARQLNEQSALTRSFLDQTPHMSWIVDEEAAVYHLNSAFCNYFGLKEKECIGRKITELVPEAVIQALFKHHLEVFDTCKAYSSTEKFKWADGSYFIAYINLFALNSIDGKNLVGGQAVVMPDKSRLEKDLHHAHERVIAISKATSDAIWEWDMQSGQIFRNDVLLEMVGFTSEDIRGLSWWLRRIHPEDRNRVADKVKEATDNCQPCWEDEYRLKCADGNYKPVRDKGFVIYENGLPIKMIGSLQDISALINLQDELADVRYVQQKEISETVIRVQEKERTRIGHELHDNVNGLLSTAILFLDMLKTTSDEHLQTKRKTGDYLRMAVEEIRKLSKELVTPRLTEERLTESIQLLIDDIKLTGAINISYNYDIDSNRLSAGKQLALFRIVQEQLKNILKHSGATQVSITLQASKSNSSLLIRDNGKGFNSHSSHKGIGLSNMRERCLFYNGEMNIHTSPGKGCELEVLIPMDEES